MSFASHERKAGSRSSLAGRRQCAGQESGRHSSELTSEKGQLGSALVNIQKYAILVPEVILFLKQFFRNRHQLARTPFIASSETFATLSAS